MWTKTDDGSIVDASGRVIFFSTARFVHDICVGGCCLICGAAPGSKPFNDEHVLPEWLLRAYNLFDRTINLPNGQRVRYGSYTVPCCAECNSLMGTEIEAPISTVLKGSLDEINDYVLAGGLLKLYVWAGLIFLKTHLKDRQLRYHLDARKGDAKIADEYDWSDLHHLHCMVRCFYNNCSIAAEAFGTFLSLPAVPPPNEAFDYADLYLAQTMHIRLGQAALFFVFDDSTGALQGEKPRLDRVAGPLSTIQCREVMADLAFINLNIKDRPIYQTQTDLASESCRIVANIPVQFELNELDLSQRGQLLRRALHNVPERMTFVGQTREAALAAIDAGTMTFLFDDAGAFIRNTADAP